MPVLTFVDQRLAQLNYLLFAGRVDSEQWQIVQRASVGLGCGELELALIGSSHVLRLRSGGEELTEVLACTPAPVGQTPLATRRAENAWTIQASCGDLDLRTVGSVERYADARPLIAVRRSILARRPQLFYIFSQGDLDTAPLTAIRFASESGGVHVDTYHTYPRDGAVVVTRSDIFPRRLG